MKILKIEKDYIKFGYFTSTPQVARDVNTQKPNLSLTFKDFNALQELILDIYYG